MPNQFDSLKEDNDGLGSFNHTKTLNSLLGIKSTPRARGS